MASREFITRKLNHLIKNYDSLNEQEQSQAMQFVLKLNNQYFREYCEMIDRMNDICDKLTDRNNRLTEDVEFYQSFINDNNLNSRYAFYCKQKGVI
ncbi:hypothetical protein RVS70_09270 [Virgibacillus sp. M23]|uniref:hypothetical protein n=1 Tax=Virgibacillus sp. M23 TaxID=3079030 RepID=UPI002A9104CB|nr:hypothetical protein [Virgibacillus sp. M23]MDY7044394.1 hypothetical protein [Virgibacillus sp. M23]